jgi:hypothetical protein
MAPELARHLQYHERYAHVVKRLSPRKLSSLPRIVSIASSAD